MRELINIYCDESCHQRRKYIKKYEAFIKAETAQGH